MISQTRSTYLGVECIKFPFSIVGNFFLTCKNGMLCVKFYLVAVYNSSFKEF